MKADLHCHTVLSDGAMRVDQKMCIRDRHTDVVMYVHFFWLLLL